MIFVLQLISFFAQDSIIHLDFYMLHLVHHQIAKTFLHNNKLYRTLVLVFHNPQKHFQLILRI